MPGSNNRVYMYHVFHWLVFEAELFFGLTQAYLFTMFALMAQRIKLNFHRLVHYISIQSYKSWMHLQTFYQRCTIHLKNAHMSVLITTV